MSTGPSTAVRQEVLARDGNACVSCGRYVVDGLFSIHHRIPRGMGGTSRLDVNLPSNLLTLCGTGTTGCHGWVESHRERAREWGYLVLRQLNPAHQPVLTPGGWLFFQNDGGTKYATPKNRDDREALRVLADQALAERTGAAA